MKIVNEKLLEKILKSILNTDRKIKILDSKMPKSVSPDEIVAKDVGSKYDFYKVKEELHEITDVVYDKMEKIDCTYDGKLTADNDRLPPLMEKMVFGDMPVIYMNKEQATEWFKTYGTDQFIKYGLENGGSVGYVITGLRETPLFLAHIYTNTLEYRRATTPMRATPGSMTHMLPSYSGVELSSNDINKEHGILQSNHTTKSFYLIYMDNISSMTANYPGNKPHETHASLIAEPHISLKYTKVYRTDETEDVINVGLIVDIDKVEDASKARTRTGFPPADKCALGYISRGIFATTDKYKYLKVCYGKPCLLTSPPEVRTFIQEYTPKKNTVKYDPDTDKFVLNDTQHNLTEYVTQFKYSHTINVFDVNRMRGAASAPAEMSHMITKDTVGGNGRNDGYTAIINIDKSSYENYGTYGVPVLLKYSATKDETEDPEYPDIPIVQHFSDFIGSRPVFADTMTPSFIIKFNVPQK